MTNQPAPADRNADTAGARVPAGNNPGSGRRRFLLAGVPVAMSLVNRPAFATGGQCTVSLLASATHSSEPLVNLNCGVSPGCWKQHALADTNTWESINTVIPGAKSASFKTVFGMPDKWQLTCSGGDATLLEVMANNFKFRFLGASGSGDDYTTADAGCPKHILAGYLNSIAFNGGLIVNGVVVTGHYPVTPSDVISVLNSTLWSQPNKGASESPSAYAARLDNAVAAVRNFAYPLGTDDNAFCDVGL